MRNDSIVPILITAEEAAQWLGISIAEVRALERLGHIKGTFVTPRSLRLVRASVVAWADRGGSTPDPLVQRITELELQVAMLAETVAGLVTREAPLRRRKPARAVIRHVLERDGNCCRYCGRKTNDTNRVLDHLIPVSQGGLNDEVNLVVACSLCNSRKGRAFVSHRKMTLRPAPNATADVNATQLELARGIRRAVDTV
jgi:HNH endonuclease